MSLDTRIAFERQQPSVALRAFLDPLKPGSYFDCGEARLHGIDEALEAEAVRRGRSVGDDEFQLVATDGGLIFCRASISFAIAARWKDLSIGRPVATDLGGAVVVPIKWPTHGDLEFTVSRRLGSNIFRRWLQIQAQATRRHQVEQGTALDQQRRSLETTSDHRFHPPAPSETATVERLGGDEALDLRHPNGPVIELGRLEDEHGTNGGTTNHVGMNGTATAGGQTDHAGTHSAGSRHDVGVEFPVDEPVDVAVGDPVKHDVGGRDDGRRTPADDESAVGPMAGGSDHGDWSALDRDLVDSWVDDRHPAPQGRTEPVPRWPHVDDDDPTSDPFEGVTVPIVEQQPAPIRFDPVDEAIVDESFDGGAPAHDDLIGVVGGDPAATQFMNRTLEGTEVFPDDGRPPARTFDRRIDRSASHGSRERWPEERSLLPVPEIRGARLQRTSYAVDAAGRPAIDIRSSVLDRGPESHLVTMLREWRLPILAVVSVLALVVLVIVGLIAGGRDQAGTVATGAADDSGQTALGGGEAQDSLGPTVPGDEDGGGDVGGIAGQTTATTATTSTTVEQSALRVTTSSVQICHSNYGGCVPVAADVDCEGDGDGPAFQADPVAVFGDDVYELDTDGDRQACEADQPASAVAGSDSGGG